MKYLFADIRARLGLCLLAVFIDYFT